jgi:AraC-like DNA-binding protein
MNFGDFFEKAEISRRFNSPAMLLFLNGKADLTFASGQQMTVADGDMLLLASGESVGVNFMETTRMATLQVERSVELFPLVRQAVFLQETILGREYVPLEINHLIRTEVQNFIEAINLSLACENSENSVVETLVRYILALYPADVLRRFFAPAVFWGSGFRAAVDAKFESVIRANRNKVFSVSKMANLTNHSYETFRLRFHRIFGMSPHQWIQRERKQLIYEELVLRSKTTSEIVALAGFNTELELYRFCKKQFGTTVKNLKNPS